MILDGASFEPQIVGLCISSKIVGPLCFLQSIVYRSSWVREFTWTLFPGEELFAPAPAEILRSDDLDDVYMILIWRWYDIICFYIMLHDAYMD